MIIENKYGFPSSNILKQFNIYSACLYDLFDGDCSFLKSCELETLTNNLGLLVIIKKAYYLSAPHEDGSKREQASAAWIITKVFVNNNGMFDMGDPVY